MGIDGNEDEKMAACRARREETLSFVKEQFIEK